MFQATRLLYLYVETPLHAGTGRALGTVDLPIQRDRVTGYPIVHASGVKGTLRAETDPRQRPGLTPQEHVAIFGPEDPQHASDHAGALSVGDARLLLFPVRSLAGVFAWVTARDALARFLRDAAVAGVTPSWTLPLALPNGATAWVNGSAISVSGTVVLEEYSFAADQSQAAAVAQIGAWLAANALPQSPEYGYWRGELPNKLCVLPEDAFRDFVLYGTEIQTHVRLSQATKTVEEGALWTVESLPVDSLLYAPLLATRSRAPGVGLDAAGIMTKLAGLKLERVQLGGDETTGQGIVALRW
jgi:CRISPR-associated protein Cmr4